MASSKDFEKIWENYQEVMKTKDVSIVDYCQRNGIVYSQFQRWYMKHVSGVSTIPNLDILLSDMERQDYIDQINDLKATIKRLLDMIDTLKQTLDSVTASNKRNEELVVKLTAQVDQLQKMVKNLEDKNQRHNKQTFGKSSLKKNKRVEEKKSREEEKEDYDGKHDNGAQVSENTDNQIDQTKVKSEYLDGERAKRADIYQLHTPNYREGIRMEMDKFTCSDNTRMNWLKKGAKMLKPLVELLKLKLLKVGSFLNIDETWCRIRIKVKGDGTKLGHYFKKYIWILINKIEQVAYFLYDNDENDSRGYRPISSFLSGFKGTVASDAYAVYKQLCLEHPEGKDVTDTLTALYIHARKALRRKGKKYSDLMLQALNYMINSWEELQNYRKDGRYTIDNLPAERAIRPFTVSRKNSLHYSSEEGVEMAMTYLTIIETAKMWGLQVKEYLTYVWREVISGNTDYESMTPEMVIAKQNS